MGKMETVKRLYRVNRKDIHYLRSTIESYDGMAVVRTMDSRKACIELLISPGCEDMICDLVESMVKEEGIAIEKETL